ncbi:MAG: hypothetical protein OEV40_12825 [Acidimicrobiia bacterium]|nr:hypothetical protein [Acidimicrobiia bacterium]
MRPLRFRAASPAILVMVTVLLFAGCGSAGEPETLRHEELGPDPFLSLDGRPIPAELQPILLRASEAAAEAERALGDIGHDSEATRARLDARLQATTDVLTEAGYGLIRPRSIVGVGLLPGQFDDICDLDTVIAAYEVDHAAALAFASVHGLRTGDLADYFESLTAGYLIDDVIVINHRFRDDLPQPYEIVLTAGTAVLVDDDGLPRVRCVGATPLLPAQVDLEGRIIANAAFADEVADSRIADAVPSLLENSVDGWFTNDPRQALGPPNRIAASLGDGSAASAADCRYHVTVRFVDNRLIDGPGPDLQVVELGRSESMYVSIGIDPDQLRFVGEVSGGTTTIDISDVAEADEEFSYVRLCDGPDSTSEIPGSDVDAVAALNSVRR